MASDIELEYLGEPEVQEIESLCFNCHKNGTTRLLLTSVRFFNEIMVSSFKCESCGYENRSIDPIGKIKPKGQKITINVRNKQDLDRKVARPKHCVVSIDDLGEFPCSEGAITTVEGLVTSIINNIKDGQTQRRLENESLADQLDCFIAKLETLLKLENPIQIVLDDPSGNGLVESFTAPDPDPQLSVVAYVRTSEQNEKLGYAADEGIADLSTVEEEDEKAVNDEENFVPQEVMQFETPCQSCRADCKLNMKTVDIPHFKEVILMALSCEKCGFRSNEVKAGGGIEPKGRRFELLLTSPSDLARDVLKSETAGLCLPEVGVEATAGTLGSRFTTVEGLLVTIRDDLSERNPFVFGDSAGQEKSKLREMLDRLEKVISGEMLNVKFILDDPAGNSYLQNYYAPEEDPNMKVVDYERTEEQNDSIGFSGMNTKDFETVPDDAS